MKAGWTVLLAGESTRGPAPRSTEIRDMAQQAEAAGLDSLWLYDHLLYRCAGHDTVGMWECWTIFAALAEATERVELGTLVICHAFRNPALAERERAVTAAGSSCASPRAAGFRKPAAGVATSSFPRRAARRSQRPPPPAAGGALQSDRLA
ncbi:MAG: LLM class flavin-dependent oxidoreductase [Candidatus Tectomicrobia bacterium]